MNVVWLYWKLCSILCTGWSVLHCDREHPHHHRRCCSQVQLWPAQPPLRPHTEGLVHLPLDSFIFLNCVFDFSLCVFRAGRWRVTAWDRSFWVWLDGSAGRLAPRQPQERCVSSELNCMCISVPHLKVELWTCLNVDKLHCGNAIGCDWSRIVEASESFLLLHCSDLQFLHIYILNHKK